MALSMSPYVQDIVVARQNIRFILLKDNLVNVNSILKHLTQFVPLVMSLITKNVKNENIEKSVNGLQNISFQTCINLLYDQIFFKSNLRNCHL